MRQGLFASARRAEPAVGPGTEVWRPSAVNYALTSARLRQGWRHKFGTKSILMPRGIDHIVHAVRDLDAAVDLYRRLGFTVGARNRHPWGTHNHIVQLPGAFIELLAVAEPERLGGEGFARLFGD